MTSSSNTSQTSGSTSLEMFARFFNNLILPAFVEGQSYLSLGFLIHVILCFSFLFNFCAQVRGYF